MSLSFAFVIDPVQPFSSQCRLVVRSGSLPLCRRTRVARLGCLPALHETVRACTFEIVNSLQAGSMCGTMNTVFSSRFQIA